MGPKFLTTTNPVVTFIRGPAESIILDFNDIRDSSVFCYLVWLNYKMCLAVKTINKNSECSYPYDRPRDPYSCVLLRTS